MPFVYTKAFKFVAIEFMKYLNKPIHNRNERLLFLFYKILEHLEHLTSKHHTVHVSATLYVECFFRHLNGLNIVINLLHEFILSENVFR